MIAGTAENSHLKLQVAGKEAHWEGHQSFETSKSAPQRYNSFNKATPPNLSQTLIPNLDQTFMHGLMQVLFIHPNVWYLTSPQKDFIHFIW